MMIKPLDMKENTKYLVQILEKEQNNHFPREINQSADISLGIYCGDEYIGGVTGSIFGNRLHVSLLGVSQAFRQHRYGEQLMMKMEKIARGKNCKYVTVNTQDFQAVHFYQKLGFSVFGELVDCPFEGTTKYFLQKELSY